MGRKCIDARRFILTGTPGSGKTSVIRELEKLGYVVIHEAATDVIAQEQAKKGFSAKYDCRIHKTKR